MPAVRGGADRQRFLGPTRQADAFLSENPEYDGKDVIVGIMDTGVGAGGGECPVLERALW